MADVSDFVPRPYCDLVAARCEDWQRDDVGTHVGVADLQRERGAHLRPVRTLLLGATAAELVAADGAVLLCERDGQVGRRGQEDPDPCSATGRALRPRTAGATRSRAGTL